MTDFYDRWLKIDPWNSEHAAYIVNGKDPDLYGGKVKFPNKIEDNYKINRKEWQRKICWTHHIFESARKDFWERYVDLDSDYNFYFRHPKEASPNAFISFAIDKELDLPPELLEKWEKLNSDAKNKGPTKELAPSSSPVKEEEQLAKADSNSGVNESNAGQDSGKTKAPPLDAHTEPTWRVRSKEIGAEAYREDTDLLKESIARKVEEQLAIEGWRDRSGKPISFDNIMRNGLKGIFNSKS